MKFRSQILKFGLANFNGRPIRATRKFARKTKHDVQREIGDVPIFDLAATRQQRQRVSGILAHSKIADPATNSNQLDLGKENLMGIFPIEINQAVVFKDELLPPNSGNLVATKNENCCYQSETCNGNYRRTSKNSAPE